MQEIQSEIDEQNETADRLAGDWGHLEEEYDDAALEAELERLLAEEEPYHTSAKAPDEPLRKQPTPTVLPTPSPAAHQPTQPTAATSTPQKAHGTTPTAQNVQHKQAVKHTAAPTQSLFDRVCHSVKSVGIQFVKAVGGLLSTATQLFAPAPKPTAQSGLMELSVFRSKQSHAAPQPAATPMQDKYQQKRVDLQKELDRLQQKPANQQNPLQIAALKRNIQSCDGLIKANQQLAQLEGQVAQVVSGPRR